MQVQLTIVLGAFRAQWRRAGVALLLGSVLAALLTPAASTNAVPLFDCLLFLVGAVAPVTAALGYQRWARSGPLAVATPAGRQATAIASYGLGTALWVMPVALLAWIALAREGSAGEIGLGVIGVVSLLCSQAGLGAAAGRVATGPITATVGALVLVLGSTVASLVLAAVIGSLAPSSASSPLVVTTLLGVPAFAAVVSVELAGRFGRPSREFAQLRVSQADSP